MRQFLLIFMEQRMDVAQLTPVEGENGRESFLALDQDSALDYITAHLAARLTRCVRAELTSMLIVDDPAISGGIRLVDDSHANPYCHDSCVRFNGATGLVEMDFESTQTALLADLPMLRTMYPT